MVLPPTYMKPSRASTSGSSAACALAPASSMSAVAAAIVICFMICLPARPFYARPVLLSGRGPNCLVPAAVNLIMLRQVDKDEIPMGYENIQVETKGRVGIIRFHRPQALNALNAALVEELIAAIDACEADINIGCLLITGSDKAFAAGADIKEMMNKTYQEANMQDFGGGKDRIARCRKPVVAAVAGFALGGGCEFAMQADIIIAAD